MKNNKLLKGYLIKLRDKLQQNIDIMQLNGEVEERHIKALLTLLYNGTFQNQDTLRTIREIRLEMDFNKLDLNPDF